MNPYLAFLLGFLAGGFIGSVLMLVITGRVNDEVRK